MYNKGSTKGEPNRASTTLLHSAFGISDKMEIAHTIVQVGGQQAATCIVSETVEDTCSCYHLNVGMKN